MLGVTVGFVAPIFLVSPSTGCVVKNASMAFCSVVEIVGDAYTDTALPTKSVDDIRSDSPIAAVFTTLFLFFIVFIFPSLKSMRFSSGRNESFSPSFLLELVNSQQCSSILLIDCLRLVSHVLDMLVPPHL